MITAAGWRRLCSQVLPLQCETIPENKVAPSSSQEQLSSIGLKMNVCLTSLTNENAVCAASTLNETKKNSKMLDTGGGVYLGASNVRPLFSI